MKEFVDSLLRLLDHPRFKWAMLLSIIFGVGWIIDRHPDWASLVASRPPSLTAIIIVALVIIQIVSDTRARAENRERHRENIERLTSLQADHNICRDQTEAADDALVELLIDDDITPLRKREIVAEMNQKRQQAVARHKPNEFKPRTKNLEDSPKRRLGERISPKGHH